MRITVAEEAKKTIKKVTKGLKKASKTHASQAKALSSIELKKGGSVKKKKKKSRRSICLQRKTYW